jgi:hypothetical protein
MEDLWKPGRRRSIVDAQGIEQGPFLEPDILSVQFRQRFPQCCDVMFGDSGIECGKAVLTKPFNHRWIETLHHKAPPFPWARWKDWRTRTPSGNGITKNRWIASNHELPRWHLGRSNSQSNHAFAGQSFAMVAAFRFFRVAVADEFTDLGDARGLDCRDFQLLLLLATALYWQDAMLPASRQRPV